MAKEVKEEAKEIEVKEEHVCACGEECKCKKGKARKVVLRSISINTLSFFNSKGNSYSF